MINQERYIIQAVLLVFLLLSVLFVFKKVLSPNSVGSDNSGIIDDNDKNTSIAVGVGKSLFTQNCASCHSFMKDMTGPALSGLEARGPWKDRKKLYEWIYNPPKFITTNNYAKALKEKFGVVMTAFPNLQEKEIDAIVDYINSYSRSENSPMSVAVAL